MRIYGVLVSIVTITQDRVLAGMVIMVALCVVYTGSMGSTWAGA